MTTTKFRFRFSRGMKYDFLYVRCSFCGCAELDKDLCRKTELLLIIPFTIMIWKTWQSSLLPIFEKYPHWNNFKLLLTAVFTTKILNSFSLKISFSNYPFSLPYNSHDINSKLIFYFILITCHLCDWYCIDIKGFIEG